MRAFKISATPTFTPAEGFEQTVPLPWSAWSELALFALFGAFIVAGVNLCARRVVLL